MENFDFDFDFDQEREPGTRYGVRSGGTLRIHTYIDDIYYIVFEHSKREDVLSFTLWQMELDGMSQETQPNSAINIGSVKINPHNNQIM